MILEKLFQGIKTSPTNWSFVTKKKSKEWSIFHRMSILQTQKFFEWIFHKSRNFRRNILQKQEFSNEYSTKPETFESIFFQ